MKSFCCWRISDEACGAVITHVACFKLQPVVEVADTGDMLLTADDLPSIRGDLSTTVPFDFLLLRPARKKMIDLTLTAFSNQNPANVLTNNAD